MISAEDIKKLRIETGVGVMECRKALEEALGDFEKAKKILSSNAEATAKKKAERFTSQGIVDCYLHNNKIGVLIEVSCESDFVAKNAEFKGLVHEVAMQIASMKPKNVSELLEQNYIRDEKLTIKKLIEEKIAKIGENIQVKRFMRYESGEEIG